MSSIASAHSSVDLPSLQPLDHAHPLLTAPDFSADNFLLSRVYIPLEELRAELRDYLAVLREELVQLINDDYEEFISLGTGLRGEEERLRSLQLPFRELAEDVDIAKAALGVHQDAIQTKLEERTGLREEKSLLDSLQRLLDTLARAEALIDGEEEDRSKLVPRVANEYTQLVYLLGKASSENCQIIDTVSPRVEAIRSRLSSDLALSLSNALQSPSSHNLKQTLQTYELIEGWEDARSVLRRTFHDFCKISITSSALLIPPTPAVPQTPITPMIHIKTFPFAMTDKLEEEFPLALLYNRVLAQVEAYTQLISLSEGISDRFDLFVGVLWPEIASAIMENLGGTIFSAGRPDELHKYYTTTHRFISQLESLSPSAQAVLDLRESPSYEILERKWQLPVYFQLRWKEIVTAFETSLAGSSTSTTSTSTVSTEWSLAQSAATWQAVTTCWSDKVFIPELSPRFWRLTLQIVARFTGWLKSRLDEIGNDESAEEAALKMAASAVMDSDRLHQRLLSIRQIKENDLASHLTVPVDPFADKIISILTRRCTDPLKLVRSVASQFRATPSRNTELAPSYFISSILKPLQAFLTAHPSLASKYGSQWSSNIIDSVCSSYAGILAGVRKTEDLLRRHRKSKKGGLSLFGGTQTPDNDDAEDEKFRNQMKLDVQALAKEAQSVGVKTEDLAAWQELIEVVRRPVE